MTAPRIAVLAGGLSFERDVSLRSGTRITDALENAGWTAELLDLDAHLLERLAHEPPSAAVLALHGKSGEDGTVQNLLEMLGVPYTGPDPAASALVWDKALCKGVVARGGVRTPPWVTVTSDAIRDLGASRLLHRLHDQIGPAMVVKPTQGGGCMGVGLVEDPAGLNDALLRALSYHDAALIERFVPGAEISVALLDGRPLPPVEIVPKEGLYDFRARYTHGATELFAPARLDASVLERCKEAALHAWNLTGCRDIARADFIVDDDGVPWLLEIDTCPGMTETSLVPTAVRAEGTTFDDFCVSLARLALRRTPHAVDA